MKPFKPATNDAFIDALLTDPLYEIRPDGSVWTLVCRTGKISLSRTWRRLSVRTSTSGHLSVKYQRKHLALHRIMYRKFKGPLDEALSVNHIDGNKENNSPDNLELITHSENMLHCFRVLGHKPMKPRQKITQSMAEDIRQLNRNGRSYRDLGKEFGLSKSSISYIVNNHTWK
jgi:hypothetical protein